MSLEDQQHILLDLNNPVFQRQLFSLSKHDQRSVLKTLCKLARMTWYQFSTDNGLKWETLLSKKGPDGKKIYSFRIGIGFRGIAFRDGDWMRLLSLHLDHASAYR